MITVAPRRWPSIGMSCSAVGGAMPPTGFSPPRRRACPGSRKRSMPSARIVFAPVSNGIAAATESEMRVTRGSCRTAPTLGGAAADEAAVVARSSTIPPTTPVTDRLESQVTGSPLEAPGLKAIARPDCREADQRDRVVLGDVPVIELAEEAAELVRVADLRVVVLDLVLR